MRTLVVKLDVHIDGRGGSVCLNTVRAVSK